MDPLVSAALKARENARAKYSNFKVGAALEDASGRVHTGSNVENSSYGLTMCAERVALFKALSEGVASFRRIAIATGAEQPTPPCGACRQVLWEFCRDIEVILANRNGVTRTFRLRDLFPEPFDDANLT
jgi:cytidine deaminase